jgi:hypothetical protein
LDVERTERLHDYVRGLPNTLPEDSLYPASLKNEPRSSVV